jgi:hypothetical protein
MFAGVTTLGAVKPPVPPFGCDMYAAAATTTMAMTTKARLQPRIGLMPPELDLRVPARYRSLLLPR